MSEATGEVRQAIVIGLGQIGGQALACLAQRLTERHKGVATIRLLAMSLGGDGQDRYPGQEEIHSIDLSFDLAEMLQETQTSITRWLPDEVVAMAKDPERLFQIRACGRLAIFRHAQRIHALVRAATDTVLSVATRSDLEPRGLRVKDEGSLDIYILAALDEPFASGALLDLAYIVAHILQQEVPDRVFPQITGVLFLPSLQSPGPMTGLSDTEISAHARAEHARVADAYAALKEIDYHMDRKRHQASYSIGLTLDQKAPPFQHSCYLVDAINERNKGMPDRDQALEMVAEWLYQMLASPLKDGFQMGGVPLADVRSQGKVAAYSGLGLAAYFLPIDEIIDICAYRLASDMVGQHFLRTADPDATIPTADFSVQLHEAQSRLRDDSAWDTKIVPFVNVPEQHFTGIAPHDLDRLEGQIRRTFDFRMSHGLRELRKGMGVNLEEALEAFQAGLAEKISRGINASPTGGISLARRFLHKQREDLATAEARARTEGQSLVNEKRETDTRIQNDRASHVAAVKAFGSRWAIGGLIAAFSAFVVMAYYAEFAILNKLELIRGLDFGSAPTVAAIVVIVGNLLALAVAGKAGWDWWQRSRNSYIEGHRRRLALALDIELKGVETAYYRRAQGIVDEQIMDVVDFQTRLEMLLDRLSEALRIPRPLYGTPRFAIEESVIDEDDVDRFYREMVGDSLEDEILALFIDHGPFYRWKNAADEEIITALLEFGRRRFDVLRRTKSAESLLVERSVEATASTGGRLRGRLSTAEMGLPESKSAVRRRMEQLRDRSMPFLRYSDLVLDAGVTASLVHQVGFEGARNPDSLLCQVLDDQGISRMHINDRHRIISMATRHGLPLAAVGVIRRWRTHYEAFRDSGTRMLHTQRTHLALPDLFPLADDLLQPQMAVAMGIAYGILEQAQDARLTFRYRDDLDENVEADLGSDKLTACVFLQNEPTVLRILSRRIDKETVARAESLDEEGQKKGNRGVIRELRLLRRRRREEGVLEDWESIMIDEFIARLER